MNQKYRGVLCILFSSFCFALMSTFVRLAGDVPLLQKSFFRNIVALLFAFIVIKKDKISLKWKKGNGKDLLLRSFCGTVGILCNFYAVDHLVLSDAVMLNKMSPFFVIIFSFLLLKEKLNFIQVISVVIAFVGSLFIIKPTFTNMSLIPSLVGLLGGLSAGMAYTEVRKLGKNGEEGPVIVFCFSAFSCLVVLPYVLLNFAPMTFMQLLYLLLAGLAATGGQFGVTAAYSYAPAREISVYDYSQIIYAAILGFLLFGQVPDLFSFIGYSIICGVGIGMFFYNKHKD